MSIKVLDNFSKFLLYIESAKMASKGNALKVEGVKKNQSINVISSQLFHLLGKEKLMIPVQVKNALAGRIEIITGFEDDQRNALMREVALVIRCRNAVIKQNENLVSHQKKGLFNRIRNSISRVISLFLNRPAPASRAFKRKIQKLYGARFTEALKRVEGLPIPKEGKSMLRNKLKEVEKAVQQAVQKGEVPMPQVKVNQPPKRILTPKKSLKKVLHTPIRRVITSKRKATPKIRILTPKKHHKPMDRADLFRELLAKRRNLKHVGTPDPNFKTPAPAPTDYLYATLTEMNKRLADSSLEVMSDQGGSWTSI